MKIHIPILVTLALVSTVQAKTIYVDDNASPGGNGTSWASAHKYLQDALADVNASDEIWVAEGMYKPDQGAGKTAGDRTATFSLVNGIDMYGGFIGSESSREPLGDMNQTILSGEIDEDSELWSLHVVSCINLTNYSVNGFVITKGNANDSNGGGGVFGLRGTFTNCAFTNNSATNGGAVYGIGTFTDCTFANNSATNGGAAYGIGDFTNCTFNNNSATNNGGALRGRATLKNCTFNNNSATIGGAAYGRGPYSGSSFVTKSDTIVGDPYPFEVSVEVDLGDFSRPSPAEAEWSFAEDHGAGWKGFDWFGYYFDTGSNWIYHFNLGWLYRVSDKTDSIWLWDSSLGWLWTSSSEYPFLCSHSRKGWLYYAKNVSPVYFWDYNASEWFAR